jgi:site-specific recombinase XerC
MGKIATTREDLNLYVKVLRYDNNADLVRQLGSLTEERIAVIAVSRKGRCQIRHFSNSNAAFASNDKSLFDVSWKKHIGPSKCQNTLKSFLIKRKMTYSILKFFDKL